MLGEHEENSESISFYYLSFSIFHYLQLFEQMCVALGGRVAESIIFNSVTSGMYFNVFGIFKCIL